MTLLVESIILLCGLGLLLLILLALLSPFEALGWWAGWSRRRLAPTTPVRDGATLTMSTTGRPAPAPVYVVYLTAIGGISAEELSGRERGFLERLRQQLPEAVLIHDVFPFSVTNNPLNGERQFAWLWERIHKSRLRGRPGILSAFIFARNLFQVGVSADPRYGPIYNVGVGYEIARSLFRHGYPAEGGRPIVSMGWSGGGQIALGVGRYLAEGLGAPVYAISIGGVLSNDPSLSYISHLYHLEGSKDAFPHIGDVLFPGRWPIVPYSAWNQARQQGKITFLDPGPMRHTGHGDYFDQRTLLPDGQSHVDKTVAVISEIIGKLYDHSTP
jgi:hypothetical protein